jgi:cytochrome c oxidase assembly protein subunit 15
VQTRVTVLLVVLVAQAGVGYVQYFSDIPPLLVGIHIAGATAVFAATLSLYLSMFEHEARMPAPETPVSPSEGVLAAS